MRTELEGLEVMRGMDGEDEALVRAAIPELGRLGWWQDASDICKRVSSKYLQYLISFR